MEFVLFILGALVVFAMLSLLCGYDSRDRFDSAEWKRRGEWRGFSGN